MEWTEEKVNGLVTGTGHALHALVDRLSSPLDEAQNSIASVNSGLVEASSQLHRLSNSGNQLQEGLLASQELLYSHRNELEQITSKQSASAAELSTALAELTHVVQIESAKLNETVNARSTVPSSGLFNLALYMFGIKSHLGPYDWISTRHPLWLGKFVPLFARGKALHYVDLEASSQRTLTGVPCNKQAI